MKSHFLLGLVLRQAQYSEQPHLTFQTLSVKKKKSLGWFLNFFFQNKSPLFNIMLIFFFFQAKSRLFKSKVCFFKTSLWGYLEPGYNVLVPVVETDEVGDTVPFLQTLPKQRAVGWVVREVHGG